MNDIYVSPVDGSKLIKTVKKADIEYLDEFGNKYKVYDGVPDFIYPRILKKEDTQAKEFYDDRADSYDDYLHLTFETFYESEDQVRNKMISFLELKEAQIVLEVGCGTGRDSVKIIEHIGARGKLFLQDISLNMIIKAKQKLEDKPNIQFCVSNASHLPYPDNFFDCLYQFGGVGEFSDIKQFFTEVVRVVKKGGKVVIGDESMPVWLRDSEFGKTLINHNPLFLTDVPLKYLPVEARDVCLRWVIGGTFFLIEFTVGEGEPDANFDFDIPGARGGTHRTRLEGQLEGVTPEAKELAHRAREELGISMHQWLDSLVKAEAKKVLDKK